MTPLVRAKVLGQVGNKAILLVGGKPITVKSEQSLLEGTKVQGRFSKVSGGFEITKRLSPEGTTGRNHLSSYFKNNGIAATELNFLTGSKLMEMGKSLDPKVFSDMSRYLNLVGDVTELNVEVVLTAMSKNLPMSKGVLSLLSQFLPFGSFKKLLNDESEDRVNDKQLRNLRALLPELKNKGIDIKSFLLDMGVDEEVLLQKGVFESDILRELELRKEPAISKLLKDLFSFYKILAEKGDNNLDVTLHVPFVIDDELDELALRYKREEGDLETGEDGRHSVEMLLTMSELGSTYVQFMLNGAKLAVTMKLENLPNDIDINELEKDFLTIDGIESVKIKIVSEQVDDIGPSKKRVEAVKLDIKA